jgi:hypothetical protein
MSLEIPCVHCYYLPEEFWARVRETYPEAPKPIKFYTAMPPRSKIIPKPSPSEQIDNPFIPSLAPRKPTYMEKVARNYAKLCVNENRSEPSKSEPSEALVKDIHKRLARLIAKPSPSLVDDCKLLSLTSIEFRPGSVPLTTYRGEDISRYNLYIYNNEVYKRGSNKPCTLYRAKGRPYYVVGFYKDGNKDYTNIYPDELFGTLPPPPPPEPNPDQYKQILQYDRRDISHHELYIRKGKFYHREADGSYTRLYSTTINRSSKIDCNGFIFEPHLIKNNIPKYIIPLSP